MNTFHSKVLVISSIKLIVAIESRSLNIFHIYSESLSFILVADLKIN